jgi:uncharacterized membrane protein YkoI
MVTKLSNSARRCRTSAVSRGAGVLCAAAVAGALLTGCGSDGNDNDSGTKAGAGEAAEAPATTAATSASATDGNLTDDQAERKDLIPKAKVGYDKALRTAVAAVPESKPVSIELKGPPDSPGWDAKVATDDGTEHTVRVDAVTGKAGQTRAKDQDTDDKRELADWLKKATVTAPQAAKTATDKKKGTVSAVELDDTDQGGVMWSVDVVTTDDWNKTTYDIDATNRKVLREHVDRD